MNHFAKPGVAAAVLKAAEGSLDFPYRGRYPGAFSGGFPGARCFPGPLSRTDAPALNGCHRVPALVAPPWWGGSVPEAAVAALVCSVEPDWAPKRARAVMAFCETAAQLPTATAEALGAARRIRTATFVYGAATFNQKVENDVDVSFPISDTIFTTHFFKEVNMKKVVDPTGREAWRSNNGCVVLAVSSVADGMAGAASFGEGYPVADFAEICLAVLAHSDSRQGDGDGVGVGDGVDDAVGDADGDTVGDADARGHVTTTPFFAPPDVCYFWHQRCLRFLRHALATSRPKFATRAGHEEGEEEEKHTISTDAQAEQWIDAKVAKSTMAAAIANSWLHKAIEDPDYSPDSFSTLALRGVGRAATAALAIHENGGPRGALLAVTKRHPWGMKLLVSAARALERFTDATGGDSRRAAAEDQMMEETDREGRFNVFDILTLICHFFTPTAPTSTVPLSAARAVFIWCKHLQRLFDSNPPQTPSIVNEYTIAREFARQLALIAWERGGSRFDQDVRGWLAPQGSDVAFHTNDILFPFNRAKHFRDFYCVSRANDYFGKEESFHNSEREVEEPTDMDSEGET